MRSGSEVKSSDVYRALKSSLKNRVPKAYIKDLTLFSFYYEKVLNPTKENDSDIRTHLERLKRIGITVIYPFLLNIFHEFETKKLTKNEFIESLKTIENFLIRRVICRYPSNRLTKIFLLLFAQIEQHFPNDFVQGLKAILGGDKAILGDSKKEKRYPKDDEFARDIQAVPLYGGEEINHRTKLLLEALEYSFGHKENTSLGDTKITIEHIMPQTLTEEWKTELGDDWENIHEECLHILGNLTLTGYNTELSNYTFTEKKKYLKDHKSKIQLNEYFQDIARWDRAAIEKRGENLAERALIAYPAFYVAKEESTSSALSREDKPAKLTIFGKEYPIVHWNDLVEQVFEAMIGYLGDEFEQFASSMPSYVSKKKFSIGYPRQLSNEYWVYVNYNAKDSLRVFYKVIDKVGLSDEYYKLVYE
jgi:hypothetical protein